MTRRESGYRGTALEWVGEEPKVPRRCLGVLGSLVWDRIFPYPGRDLRVGQGAPEGSRKPERYGAQAAPPHPAGLPEPVEEWGGISYSLETLSVVLPDGWVVKPFLKVGEDLSEKALEYLGTIPLVEVDPGVQVVPFRNHRVELRYLDQSRRLERLTGDVPGWSWEELAPLVGGVDALYLNFITGMEMDLRTARHLRAGFRGASYADLHSLFQGVSEDGRRFPRELPEWEKWLSAFDAVQMNQEEFELLGRAGGESWALAKERVGAGLRLVAVTLGSGGAAYVAAPDFDPAPASWSSPQTSAGESGEPLTGRVALRNGPRSGDPTGCGDVWGATFFGRLLGGSPLGEAMDAANCLAAKKMEHTGARGLRGHLVPRRES